MALDADSLTADLREHLFFWLGSVPHQERRRSRWVMTLDWWNECRKLDVGNGAFCLPSLRPGIPEILLGLPVEVRAGGGPPHLEPMP